MISLTRICNTYSTLCKKPDITLPSSSFRGRGRSRDLPQLPRRPLEAGRLGVPAAPHGPPHGHHRARHDALHPVQDVGHGPLALQLQPGRGGAAAGHQPLREVDRRLPEADLPPLAQLQPAPVEGRPLRARPRRQRPAQAPRGPLAPHHAQTADAAALAQRAGRAQDGQELRALQVRE